MCCIDTGAIRLTPFPLLTTDDTNPRLFVSLEKLTDTVVSMLQTRLELASVRLAEKKERLFGTTSLSILVMSLVALPIMTLTALMVILCQGMHHW